MPVQLPFALLVLAGLSACSPGSSSTTEDPARDAAPGAAAGAPPPTTTDAMTSISPGDHLYASAQSGHREPAQLVLRDRAAWQAVWATLHEGAGGEAPAVDFARQMVVMVALGERTSGGFALQVDRVVTSGTSATVHYTVTSPGSGCMTTQALTAPADAVRVPRVSGEVRFEPRAVVQRC